MNWNKMPLWDEKVKVLMFVKERDEACLSFDVDTDKRFYRRWVGYGVFDDLDMDDNVIEIAMRKMVCNMKNPAPEKLAEAEAWLEERGHSKKL